MRTVSRLLYHQQYHWILDFTVINGMTDFFVKAKHVVCKSDRHRRVFFIGTADPVQKYQFVLWCDTLAIRQTCVGKMPYFQAFFFFFNKWYVVLTQEGGNREWKANLLNALWTQPIRFPCSTVGTNLLYYELKKKKIVWDKLGGVHGEGCANTFCFVFPVCYFFNCKKVFLCKSLWFPQGAVSVFEVR